MRRVPAPPGRCPGGVRGRTPDRAAVLVPDVAVPAEVGVAVLLGHLPQRGDSVAGEPVEPAGEAAQAGGGGRDRPRNAEGPGQFPHGLVAGRQPREQELLGHDAPERVADLPEVQYQPGVPGLLRGAFDAGEQPAVLAEERARATSAHGEACGGAHVLAGRYPAGRCRAGTRGDGAGHHEVRSSGRRGSSPSVPVTWRAAWSRAFPRSRRRAVGGRPAVESTGRRPT